jgi:hypothetical protein
MPDVTQVEVGRRLYHVHREKRVELAIKQILQSPGPGWKSLKEEGIPVQGRVLQSMWNTIDQKNWDTIPFNTMSTGTVRKILS